MLHGQFVRGKLIGVVDGPAMILDIRGEERQFPLDADVPVPWIDENMDRTVTVVVQDGRIARVL